MKKFRKALSILICSFIIFLICDISFFYYVRNNVLRSINKNKEFYKEKIVLPHYYLKLIPPITFYKDVIENSARPIMNIDSTKRPIVIFGCSYAYGYIFDNEETISYILSKHSNRPIFNRARNAWGIQHALYQLKNDKELIKEIKNPKYIFYILMGETGHFQRLYYTNFPSVTEKDYYLTYIIKNNELIERKPLLNLYYDFSLTRHIYNKVKYNWIEQNFYPTPNKKIIDFFVIHFKTINDLIVKKWGNDTKFIILTFENTQKEYWQKEIENLGIDVIDIAETIGKTNLKNPEYDFFEPKNDPTAHPVGKLWEELIPKLKEKYPDL